MQQQTININLIKPNEGQIEGLPSNPRFIKDDSYKSLVKSLREDPDMLELRELIVMPVNGEYVTIGGNMRLRAGMELQFQEMPCKVLPEDTTVDKLKRIAIKDNGSWGSHDWDALANDWHDSPLDEWGIIMPNFSEEAEADYSDKNKEIDLDEYEEKMEFKLKLTSDQFFDLQERLSVVKAKQNVDTNEDAIFKLLSLYEQRA